MQEAKGWCVALTLHWLELLCIIAVQLHHESCIIIVTMEVIVILVRLVSRSVQAPRGLLDGRSGSGGCALRYVQEIGDSQYSVFIKEFRNQPKANG